MPEKKTDRRTLKTKKALVDALAVLLTEKELSKVTVQEIADKADVNRVTFYKHYLDVYDLYDNIEKDVLLELGILMLKLQELPSQDVFSYLTDYINENRTIFKLIFCSNSSEKLKNKFNKLIEGVFRQIQSEKQNVAIHDIQLEYQNCYRSQGCIAVLAKWVFNDFSESKDFVVKILSDLDFNTENLIMKKK